MAAVFGLFAGVLTSDSLRIALTISAALCFENEKIYVDNHNYKPLQTSPQDWAVWKLSMNCEAFQKIVCPESVQ